MSAESARPDFFFFISKVKGLTSQIYLPRIWYGNSLNVFLASTFTLSYYLIFISFYYPFDGSLKFWSNPATLVKPRWRLLANRDEIFNFCGVIIVFNGPQRIILMTYYISWSFAVISFSNFIYYLFMSPYCFFTNMTALLKYMQISARSFLCTIKIVLDSTSSHKEAIT